MLVIKAITEIANKIIMHIPKAISVLFIFVTATLWSLGVIVVVPPVAMASTWTFPLAWYAVAVDLECVQ